MLWALASSAYVIYLYRKLNAASAPDAPDAGDGIRTIEAEFAELDAKIDRLESRLRGRLPQ